jgi:Arc/MetJ-type ribon-helix-helix transcriptional regulator
VVSLNIEIPKEIGKRLQRRVDETHEFGSVQEYVIYILQQVIEKLDAQTPEYSAQDEAKIKERLKNLGYLE